MREIILRAILATALTLASLTASAQQTVNIEESVKQIVEEMDNIKGFDCLVLTHGLQLKIVKEIFKQKFGKEFMKDVTSILLVNYSKASEEDRKTFRGKIEEIAAQLQEFRLSEQHTKEAEYTRGYATVIEKSLISNLMVITENDGKALFFYMSGTLNTSKMELDI